MADALVWSVLSKRPRTVTVSIWHLTRGVKVDWPEPDTGTPSTTLWRTGALQKQNSSQHFETQEGDTHCLGTGTTLMSGACEIIKDKA